MRRYVLVVPNISCEHCVKRISNLLTKLGIENFEVQLSEKRIKIEAEQEILEKAVNELEELGYKVVEMNVEG
ncbi:heavy-metal-associated domain-containing protein [Fervidobacterium thailandense]|uniref:HMA domain-containing protein n=1 Tax=Fervidobacterium thailandense TaxID=1008305 RepID=A0A1E3G1J0_9BACT|nr:heavy-metal-associated domain-containing protein [Fervidobacterium thailandense]ODN30116.1 hypothetical protein A4H02_07380 [Fervidobacterium thailandense]